MEHEKAVNLKAWKDKIAVLFLVQEEIQRLDKSGIWQSYYPELAATEEQLAAVKEHLGHPIDKSYRDFLKCAYGWKCFTQTVNLFGTEDLMGSSLMNYALEALDFMDDAFSISESSGFSKEELLPLAATFEDRELHVITRPTSNHPELLFGFLVKKLKDILTLESISLQWLNIIV